jgi:GNAT superfamily N-acetyltransferase
MGRAVEVTQRAPGTDNANNSIHSLGQVGHIEDIAVAKDQQGKKLGLRIIQALDHVAEKVGCYKVGPYACDSLAHVLVC